MKHSLRFTLARVITRRLKISPSMFVALLALFITLGGTAIAANGLISGTQIKNHTIAASKLTPNALNSLRGQIGPAGVPGAGGVQGIQGVPGAIGANGGFNPAKVTIVQSDSVPIAAGAIGTANANCPAGTTVIGGGGVNVGVGIWQDVPAGNGWQVGGESYTSIAGYVRAYAVCAAP
jgi:hypothetical protein